MAGFFLGSGSGFVVAVLVDKIPFLQILSPFLIFQGGRKVRTAQSATLPNGKAPILSVTESATERETAYVFAFCF